jgi:hypothetical protein
MMVRDTLFLDAEVARLEAVPRNGGDAVGKLEQLPKWLNLIPMVAQWVWLSLRHGSFALPAAANPAITAGGMVGEGKAEYFRIMGAHALSYTADFANFENCEVHALQAAEEAMHEAGLEYPLIVKPDIGWCGFGVRLVRDRAELRLYLAHYPVRENIILQRFIAFEGEAGLYYIRHPGEERGKLVGILLRSFPRVVGDGIRSVAALIAAHPRVRRLGQDGLSEPCCNPSYIPRPAEIVRVSITGSTRVGGLYNDASCLITQELDAAIDAIAKDMTSLHVARFDIRYESLGALRSGRAFKIIEVNGAGSEAVHAWDPKYSLFEAYKIVFEKQRVVFAIGAAMRQRGYKPPSIFALGKLHFRQANLIKRYPPSN